MKGGMADDNRILGRDLIEPALSSAQMILFVGVIKEVPKVQNDISQTLEQ